MPELNKKMLAVQWKPGQSGNPDGRPKKDHAMAEILRGLGDESIITKDGERMSKLEAILRKVYELALAGIPWAVEFIADRTEGKPKQPIQLGEIEELKVIR